MLSHILFPSDFSAPAGAAFAYVRELAPRFQAKVTLLHVHDYIPPMMAADSVQTYPSYFQDLEREVEANALQQLEKLKAELLEAGVEGAFRFSTGHAGRQIVAEASRSGCDLIVMGSRGLGAVRAFLLGSTSNYVLHHAHIPVMIIPSSPAHT